MKRFYGLLMALMCLSYGQTLHAQLICNGNTGNITVHNANFPGGGDGSAASPFQGAGTIDYCIDDIEFVEELLNWLHGITPANLPTGATYTQGAVGTLPLGPGESLATQAVGQTFLPAEEPLQWEYFNTNVTGTGLVGSILTTGPGWYVDEVNDVVADPAANGDAGNNFGDAGNNVGGIAGIPVETYTHLEQFCFSVTIPDQGAGSTVWIPSIGFTGDGVTGAHEVTPICSFFVVQDDEAIYFGDTPPPAVCGSAGTFTVSGCSGCTSGSGTQADPYVGGGTVDICFTLTGFYEDLLNWAHGVALNTASANYSVTAGAAIPAQTYTGGVPDSPNAFEWIPVNSTVTGTLLSNGPGWYVEEVGGDGDPSNNFGDDGDNPGSGVVGTSDTYNSGAGVGPFCFSYNVPATGFGNFLPSVAVSSDGQTGSHLAPTLCSALLAVAADESDRFFWGETIVDNEPNCGTQTQTSTFDFGGAIGNISGSSCGVMEITELGLVGTNSGSGTAEDPYIAPFELKTCVDVKTFDENILNWLHSVLLNNQTDLPVGTVVAATGTGVQPTAGQTADPANNGGATNWIFNPVAYGAEPAPSTWPTMVQGTSGDGFEPFPGYYADGGNLDAPNPDGDSANNFGDSGNGASGGNVPTSTTGAFLGTESFNLDPFCFSIMVGNDATTDVRRFRPQFNMAGDGSTGNWTVPTFECLLAAFIPTECGPNDDGSVYYASAEDPETDCGTDNETVSADIDGSGVLVTGAACGSMEITELGLVGTNAGSGTDADPYVTPFQMKTCVDVKTFDESLVNWLHSVFIRNRSELPAGSTITATGTGAQPTAAETLDPAANTGASEWIFVEVANEPPVTTWATLIQGVDGDGFHPYSGYYADGGPNAPEADGDTRNNLGDNGNGQSGSGATPAGLLLGDETYTLEPFCFLITVAEDTEQPGGKFRANFGMGGDGSTGAWTVPTLDCLLANYFATECGPNNDGTFAYTNACAASFDVEVNSPAVAGTNSVMSGTDAVVWDVINCTGLGRSAVDADGTDLVADLYAYIGTGGGFDPIEAPAGQMLDLSCETESTNAAGGFTGDFTDVDCALPTFGAQIGCKNPFLDIGTSQFDIDCDNATNPPTFNIPASIEDQTDCDAHTMTYFFPVYDFDRNAGANNTVPSNAFDYHPTCATPRSDVVILPVQPAIVGIADADPCAPPMAELRSNNGNAGFGVCATKAMDNICTPGANTSDWRATWTAEEISTIYTGSAAYADAYAPVTTTVTTACACAMALASEFVAFDAFPRGEVNMLEWATASEENTKYHVVERSDNGKDFVEIGRLDAQGNSNVLVQYTFEDKTPLKKSYYRIRNIDIDGSTNTTNIKVVNRKDEFDLEVTRIYPVPTSKAVTIEFDAYKSENVNIIVMDIFGKVIAKDVVETSDANNTYQLDLSTYNDGVYMVALDNGKTRITKRIVKQ